MKAKFLKFIIYLKVFLAWSTCAMEKEKDESQNYSVNQERQANDQNCSDTEVTTTPKFNKTVPSNRRRARSTNVGPDDFTNLKTTLSNSSKSIEKYEPKITNRENCQNVERPATKEKYKRSSLVDTPKMRDANYEGREGAISPMRDRVSK